MTSPADDRYGSPALRDATVRQAIEETRSIDFREAIEYKPVIRAAGLAAAALGLAAVIALAAPMQTRLALRRLFVPWGGDRWPQQTHLALSETGTTLKIARGDSFTLSVQVRPGDRIPDSARVTYRFADGEEDSEPLRATKGGEFHGRLETVTQPFRFSVAAGDDVELDPRRRGQGRASARPQPADGPAGHAALHRNRAPDPGPGPDHLSRA